MGKMPIGIQLLLGLGVLAVLVVAFVDRRSLGLYTPLEKQRMENKRLYDIRNNELLRQRAEQEERERRFGPPLTP